MHSDTGLRDMSISVSHCLHVVAEAAVLDIRNYWLGMFVAVRESKTNMTRPSSEKKQISAKERNEPGQQPRKKRYAIELYTRDHLHKLYLERKTGVLQVWKTTTHIQACPYRDGNERILGIRIYTIVPFDS